LAVLPLQAAAAQAARPAPTATIDAAAHATPPADAASTAQPGSCDQVRSNLRALRALAAGGKTQVACIEPAKPGPARPTAPSVRTGEVSSASIQPLPQWCIDHAFTGWWQDRTNACEIGQGTVTVIDVNTGAVTGQMGFFEKSLSYTNATITRWAQQLQIAPFSAWGTALGSTVQGAASCSSGACILVSSSFPPQAATTTSTASGESFFDTTATAPGAIDSALTKFTYFFTNPAWVAPSNSLDVKPPVVRCDNALPGNNTLPGCVFPDYTPTMVYAQNPADPRSFPELAHHISDAQASGLPGAYPNGQLLYRLTDSTLIERNRSTACKSSYPRPEGKTCDEYPFASTWQGAYTGGGSPRTFNWCQIPKVPQGITGPDGYSVCMIDALQNSNGGLALLSFYNSNRVLSSNTFRVWIPFNVAVPGPAPAPVRIPPL
jgi:hypothetical protein